MSFSGPGILIAATTLIQIAIFSSPLFDSTITTTEVKGMQFIGTVITAWAAIVTERLKPKHLLVGIGIYLVVILTEVIAVWSWFRGYFPFLPLARSSMSPEILPVLYSQIPTGILFQLACAGIISAGLWMKANRAPYIIRRAGTNRQEQDHLFDLRELVVSDGMTNFKYVSLQRVCPGIVLEFRGDILAYLRYVVIENFLVVFDLIILPDARRIPHSQHLPELMIKLAQQPGIEKLKVVAALPAHDVDDIQRAVLVSCGFDTIEPDQGLARSFHGFKLDGFEDWRPFGGDFQFWQRTS
ncbi:MAG: hypothetical protein JNM27_10135 [Leptospirales bacterium]|nr:hypothetical protein [Leptospirales bacterium]